ncbi:MAG TPA: lipid-A-disaccharide synthase [Gammaproteobacteria bacterium]|nr:lipid-A-disaccharide synthase [Gammaproteobacteria bacterium]
MKIAILAGEASGDLLGAKVIRALRERYPDLQVEGIGGPSMAAEGCKNLFDIERLSVMGLIEPLKRLPDLLRLRRDFYHHIIKHRPDIFIGVDAPEFNLGLEIKLRKAGIPVVHYVSPSVWAWRQNRIHKIGKAVDMMLTLLPFEAKFYEKHQVPVRYVGHPLADQIPLDVDVLAARRSLRIPENARYVTLLPGSRSQEIKHMAEPFLLAAKILWQQFPDLHFLTSHINEKRYHEFVACHKRLTPELPLHIFTRRTHDVLAAADAVIVTSGTATLETMLLKKPMVIAYRMPWLTHQIAKIVVKSLYIGLPNLLANELLVPELIQQEANPENIARHIAEYLNSPEKTEQLQNRFAEIHKSLRQDAAESLSDSILSVMHQS